jgi:hypothetical protein
MERCLLLRYPIKRRKTLFNAIKYTQELEKAGFTVEQAQVTVKVLTEVMNETFATKSDLKELSIELRSEMREMKTELRSEMRELEHRLTIKLGTMMVMGFTLMTTVLKLMHTV